MKLKFLQDFQGRETRERFYVKGQETEEFDGEQAAILIRDNRVVVIDEPAAIAAPEVDDQPKKKAKK